MPTAVPLGIGSVVDGWTTPGTPVDDTASAMLMRQLIEATGRPEIPPVPALAPSILPGS